MASQNQLVRESPTAGTAGCCLCRGHCVTASARYSMSQNLHPAPLEAGRGGCCTLAGSGSRQRLLCCIIFFQFKGSKFAVGESGQQSEVTGLNSGCKEDGKVELGWGGSGFHMKVVSDLDSEQGIPPTHRCVQRWQMTTAEVCGAQLKRAAWRFFPSCLFLFFPPKSGDSKPGIRRGFSIPSFSHSSSAKTCSQVVFQPLYLGSCSYPWGRSLVPAPTRQLRDGHGVCLMCPQSS